MVSLASLRPSQRLGNPTFLILISSNSSPSKAQLPGHLLPIKLKLNIQHSTMSPILPLEIFALIIDIAGVNEDRNLLKELSLVSHSFHQICSKHLFATDDLHDSTFHDSIWAYVPSSKKGFVKLVKIRPNVVNYIRKLMYKVGHNSNEDCLLSPILSKFHPTISRLNCLVIDASYLTWNRLDSSLTSAFLHLMSLPTINHIDRKFPTV